MSARCHHPDCGLPQGECASRDCLLLSMHRIDTATMTRDSVAIKGRVEERKQAECDLPIQFAEPEPLMDRIFCAFRLYRLYRAAGQPITTSVRRAWRALREPK